MPFGARFGLIGLAVLLINVLPSIGGEVYRWTDEGGTVHFTDDPSKVPKRYLNQMERREVPEGVLREPEGIEKPEKKPDRVKTHLEEVDRRIEEKRKIEKRMSELEEELRLCEERLKKIEAYEKEDFQYYQSFVNRKTGRLVPVASPYLEEKRRLKDRMELIRNELRPLREKRSEILRSL